MDRFSFDARLRSLKAAEVAAMQRGDIQAAKRRRERAFNLRWHWTRVQTHIYSAFEVSDGEEEEESHNCTDAVHVFSETDEDEKVGETGGVDNSEDLQSYSARDVSSKASKYSHPKKHKKTEGERCHDKVTDANHSQSEGQGEQEDLSGDDVGDYMAVFSDEDDDEKLRHTKEIDDRDELQNNLENRALKKKYQGEQEETEGEGCGNKKTDADGSEDEDHDEIPDGKRKKKKCPLSHCNSFVRHLPRHMRDVHKWSREYARTALSRLKLRKQYTFSSQENASAGNRKSRRVNINAKTNSRKKPCRRKRICPIRGCSTVTERLPQHLHHVHKIPRDNAKYKKYTSLAKVITSKKPHIFLSMKAEKAENVSGPLSTESVSTQQDLQENDLDHSVMSDHTAFHTVESDRSGSDEGLNESTDEVPLNESTNEVQQTFKQFEDWLVSPDCERKDEKTAKQHVAQVKKVLSIVGGGTCLQSLVTAQKIRDAFLRQYAEVKYLPATIKSYLMSLQHYCSFLLGEKPASGGAFEKDTVISLREKLRNWSASYKRDTTRRRWEKMEEDLSALITPDKITTFDKSQAVRDAVILLGQLSGAHNIQLTQAQYTLVRDYLIAQIMIDNANRAGVVVYMTVKEFERARKEGDRHVVRVLQHKTVNTHGPAQVVLTTPLYNHLRIFLTELRSQLPLKVPEGSNAKVFLSWGGKPMESSQMSRVLSSIFQKAGIDGPMSHTLYRKSAVSECHQNRKDISGNLADLMAHRESTAEKYYRVFDKSRSSVKASQILHGIMRNAEKSSEERLKENVEEPLPPGEEGEKRALKQSEERSQEKMEALSQKGQEVEEKAESLSTPISKSEEKMNAINQLFRAEIDAQSVSITSVREKIQLDPILCHEDAKKVYDKIRALWRYKPQEKNVTMTVALPSEKDTVADRVGRMFSESSAPQDLEDSVASSDIVSPTETTSRSKPGVFGPIQVQTLLHLFKDMINGAPISKPVIKERLQNDSQGKDIQTNFTTEQVVNRLKYERKQKREKMLQKAK